MEVLLKKFLGFLKKSNLVQESDKILIAFSGGRDSLALVDLFVRISKQKRVTIALAHFNHKLRGIESDEDAEFCRNTADSYKLDYFYDESSVYTYAKSNKLSHPTHVIGHLLKRNSFA